MVSFHFVSLNFSFRSVSYNYHDYHVHYLKDAVSEWAPGDSMSVSDPPPPPYPASPILSHIVYTLLDMVDPPQMAPSPPHMPRFLIRASIIGKPFTGKTTALHRLGNGESTRAVGGEGEGGWNCV